MMVKFFEIGNCPVCRAIRHEGYLSIIQDAYFVNKFRVDLQQELEDVRMWSQVCKGHVPAIWIPNPPTWFIGYDAIKSFAERCEELAERDLFPATIPVEVGGLA